MWSSWSGGSDPSHRCSLCHSHGNARFLTHYTRPGIEPMSWGSWDATNLVTPQRELSISANLALLLRLQDSRNTSRILENESRKRQDITPCQKKFPLRYLKKKKKKKSYSVAFCSSYSGPRGWHGLQENKKRERIRSKSLSRSPRRGAVVNESD